MTNVTKRALAACAGTIALACAVIQPANAADIPVQPQYSGPPVQEDYVYQERPRAYRYEAAPPVYYEQAPPAVVVVPEPYPEPYYVPPRRVYGGPGYYPGYGAYGYRPYVARGYAYQGGGGHYRHHHHNGHRRW